MIQFYVYDLARKILNYIIALYKYAYNVKIIYIYIYNYVQDEKA